MPCVAVALRLDGLAFVVFTHGAAEDVEGRAGLAGHDSSSALPSDRIRIL